MTRSAPARDDRLIRAAVLLAVVGLILLSGVVLWISALTVGAFMLGSTLVAIAIGLYLFAVFRELRREDVL